MPRVANIYRAASASSAQSKNSRSKRKFIIVGGILLVGLYALGSNYGDDMTDMHLETTQVKTPTPTAPLASSSSATGQGGTQEAADAAESLKNLSPGIIPGTGGPGFGSDINSNTNTNPAGTADVSTALNNKQDEGDPLSSTSLTEEDTNQDGGSGIPDGPPESGTETKTGAGTATVTGEEGPSQATTDAEPGKEETSVLPAKNDNEQGDGKDGITEKNDDGDDSSEKSPADDSLGKGSDADADADQKTAQNNEPTSENDDDEESTNENTAPTPEETPSDEGEEGGVSAGTIEPDSGQGEESIKTNEDGDSQEGDEGVSDEEDEKNQGDDNYKAYYAIKNLNTTGTVTKEQSNTDESAGLDSSNVEDVHVSSDESNVSTGSQGNVNDSGVVGVNGTTQENELKSDSSISEDPKPDTRTDENVNEDKAPTDESSTVIIDSQKDVDVAEVVDDKDTAKSEEEVTSDSNVSEDPKPDIGNEDKAPTDESSFLEKPTNEEGSNQGGNDGGETENESKESQTAPDGSSINSVEDVPTNADVTSETNADSGEGVSIDTNSSSVDSEEGITTASNSGKEDPDLVDTKPNEIEKTESNDAQSTAESTNLESTNESTALEENGNVEDQMKKPNEQHDSVESQSGTTRNDIQNSTNAVEKSVASNSTNASVTENEFKLENVTMAAISKGDGGIAAMSEEVKDPHLFTKDGNKASRPPDTDLVDEKAENKMDTDYYNKLKMFKQKRGRGEKTEEKMTDSIVTDKDSKDANGENTTSSAKGPGNDQIDIVEKDDINKRRENLEETVVLEICESNPFKSALQQPLEEISKLAKEFTDAHSKKEISKATVADFSREEMAKDANDSNRYLRRRQLDLTDSTKDSAPFDGTVRCKDDDVLNVSGMCGRIEKNQECEFYVAVNTPLVELSFLPLLDTHCKINVIEQCAVEYRSISDLIGNLTLSDSQKERLVIHNATCLSGGVQADEKADNSLVTSIIAKPRPAVVDALFVNSHDADGVPNAFNLFKSIKGERLHLYNTTTSFQVGSIYLPKQIVFWADKTEMESSGSDRVQIGFSKEEKLELFSKGYIQVPNAGPMTFMRYDCPKPPSDVGGSAAMITAGFPV